MDTATEHKTSIPALLQTRSADRIYACAARPMRQLRRTGKEGMWRHYARIALETADHLDLQADSDVLAVLSQGEEQKIGSEADEAVRTALREAQGTVSRHLEPASEHDAEPTLEELIAIPRQRRHRRGHGAERLAQ
jgi:hypothetical protein